MSEIVVNSMGSMYIPPTGHRGRSAHPFVFQNQPPSRSVETAQAETFRRALRSQGYCVLYREQCNKVYRREISPEESCVEGVTRHLHESDDDSSSETNEPSPPPPTQPTVPPPPARRLITYGKIGCKLADARHGSNEHSTFATSAKYNAYAPGGMTFDQVTETRVPFFVPAQTGGDLRRFRRNQPIVEVLGMPDCFGYIRETSLW
ncbi:hypothetical protein C8R45DRAFT_946116 [Mycena sanguinolenta]|nr:hypothetical protein C8R45DRAFT_946116 [Mycena sanguinolenta]